MTPWIQQVKARHLAEVAELLGLEVEEGRRDISFQCPACGKVRRHTKSRRDRRLAAKVMGDGDHWWCEPCNKSGDGIDLVALISMGRRLSLGDPDWGKLRSICTQYGLCSEGGSPVAYVSPLRQLSQPPPPTYPPNDEVDELWRRCQKVRDDEQATAWASSRGLCPDDIDDRNLARVLPVGTPVPDWAQRWQSTGYRLTIPLCDASGTVRSLRARSLLPGQKSMTPTGFSMSGLVMADPLASLTLSGQVLGDGTPSSEWTKTCGLVITEGEPDFLTWATKFSDSREDAPAVIGIFTGSWTPEVAARVPDGCRVAIRSHLDQAGERYAQKVIDSLQGRCTCFRLQTEATNA